MEARILVGDAVERLRELPDGSVRTCVTSPPYWGLRDYGNDGQIGLESTPMGFVENLCKVFDEVWRVLAEDGTLWLNIGDSYFSTTKGTGGMNPKTSPKNAIKGKDNFQAFEPIRVQAGELPLKQKDLVGIPWRIALALQERGWYLRQDIIWAKPNPMPESVTDRCTKSHEYIFLFSKRPKYYFDAEAIKEPLAESSIARLAQDVDSQAGSDRANGGRKTNGAMKAVGGARRSQITRGGYGRKSVPGQHDHGGPADDDSEAPMLRNKRSVWNVSVASFKDAHFAVYPPALITPCVLAGSAEGDTVLDPFSGSGTTGEVALLNGRNYVGVELNPDYARLSEKRISEAVGLFGDVEVV